MIECIRFRSVLAFDENVKEVFISEIWGGAIGRWGGSITPDVSERIEMEIATFEQVEGYMEYLYFVWRVVYDSGYYIMPYRTLAHASAVCYALGITEVDPVSLRLDFDRFMQTDKPRFVEIGLATNATKTQIQTEIMNLEFDEDRERLGERELNDDAPALIIYPSQRTAQLLGYFSDKLEYIPFDDQATFRTLLRSDDLTGVYGCNPHTVLQEYLQQAKPQFEDLIPLCTASIIDYPTNHIYTSRKYGIECHNRRFDTTGEMERTGESMEMAARRLRYTWFAELCEEHGYSVIAVAHHIDDSIETFFINLGASACIDKGCVFLHL